MNLLCLFLFLFVTTSLNAQQLSAFYLIPNIDTTLLSQEQRTKLNALLQNYHAAQHDTQRIQILNKLCFTVISRNYPFAKDYLEFVENYLKNAAQDPQLTTFAQKAQAKLWRYKGIFYRKKGQDSLSRVYFQKSIALSKQLNDKKNLAAALSSLGILYADRGDYRKALDCFFQSLKYKEALRDSEGVAKTLNNIGLIYASQQEYDKALEYYFKSLAIKKRLGDQWGIARTLNNIGIIYAEKGNHEKALEYYHQSLEIDKALNNEIGVAVSLHNIGNIYEEKGNYKKALEYLFESLRYYKKLGTEGAMAYPLNAVARVYLHLKQPAKALAYAQKAYKIAEKNGDIIPLRDAAQALSEAYEQLGNTEKALKWFKTYIFYRDSIQSESHQEELVRKELSYKYEKEKAIQAAKHKAELEKQKAIAAAQRKKQNIIIVSISLFALFILGFSAVLYRNLRIIRKQRDKIQKQNLVLQKQKETLRLLNEDLHQKNAEILVQSEELKRLNEQLKQQNEELDRKNKAITDSITYASRIQRALLQNSDEVRKALKHALFFSPCSIVSGDFYWVAQQNGLYYVAVADCTGHGVPGALLSILGMEFLNTLAQQGMDNPAAMLEQLRKHIISRLRESEKGTLHDGMDISLFITDYPQRYVIWSGANLPLCVISSHPITQQRLAPYKKMAVDNTTLFVIPPDKQPVGWLPKMSAFTAHTFTLQQGDRIFLFSDGYVDQFGGKKGKRLGYKRFYALLLQTHNVPVTQLQEHLATIFHRWKGTTEQIDDVTIMAIEF